MIGQIAAKGTACLSVSPEGNPTMRPALRSVVDTPMSQASAKVTLATVTQNEDGSADEPRFMDQVEPFRLALRRGVALVRYDVHGEAVRRLKRGGSID